MAGGFGEAAKELARIRPIPISSNFGKSGGSAGDVIVHIVPRLNRLLSMAPESKSKWTTIRHHGHPNLQEASPADA